MLQFQNEEGPAFDYSEMSQVLWNAFGLQMSLVKHLKILQAPKQISPLWTRLQLF